MLHFLGIGAQKAATTWLFEWLRTHPQLHFPADKELHFWDDWERAGGCGDIAPWLALFDAANPTLREGELTPAYASLEPATLEALHAVAPGLRLFYVLRNPIDRAWAAARMALERSELSIEEVGDRWFAEHFRSRGSRARGAYTRSIERWRGVFGSEALHLVWYDDLCDQPRETLAGVALHLGVDPAHFDRFEEEELRRAVHSRDSGSVPDALRALLEELYDGEITALAELTGRDLSAWRSAPSAPSAATRPTKLRASHDAPNVLFVCADDLNGWIGALGRHPGAHTPNIDALAESGTHFTHAYCTAPHCNPSRASVFTGLRPTTTGVFHGESLRADAEALCTLPEELRASGHRTFAAGKVYHGYFDYEGATQSLASEAPWLDTHGRPASWDEYHACADEPLPSGRPFNGFWKAGSDRAVDGWNALFDWGPLPPELEHSLPDERVVERSCEYLERATGPFFCAVGLYRPHLPWYVPQRFFDLHPLEDIVLPAVRSDDLDDVPEIARRWATERPDHALILKHGEWRRAVQGYLAASSYCDWLLGRLLATLDATGRSEDTIVVLWGDNGFHLGEKLHWRKFTLWEEATRVPLVIRAPGSSAPGFCFDHPVSLLDLYPTLAELCRLDGNKRPQTLEGESLVPHLAGPGPPRASLPISTWGRDNHSVRSPEWRYTRYADGSVELYDHQRDPHEWHNLGGEPQHAAVREELAAWLPPLAGGAERPPHR